MTNEQTTQDAEQNLTELSDEALDDLVSGAQELSKSQSW
jgi:hypothetical protein